jgi:hypothetical protein
MSKLMQRKQAWARAYAAKVDARLAELLPHRIEDADERRKVALLRAFLQADKAWTLVAIKDGRSPVNRRRNAAAAKTYHRALDALLADHGYEGEYRPYGDKLTALLREYDERAVIE